MKVFQQMFVVVMWQSGFTCFAIEREREGATLSPVTRGRSTRPSPCFQQQFEIESVRFNLVLISLIFIHFVQILNL